MKFSDMPKLAQEALRDKFIEIAKADFDDMEDEMLHAFFQSPDIQKEWKAYRMMCFDQYIDDSDTECAWHEWLEEHGIDPR